MPLHRIYHHPNAFTDEEKREFANAITEIYTPLMPAFFVVVLFIPVETSDYFVGGKSTDKFVRIVIQHLHVKFDNDKKMYKFADYYESRIAPWTKDKGFNWEIHVEDTSRAGWRTNGIYPPIIGEEEIGAWIDANKALPRPQGFVPKL